MAWLSRIDWLLSAKKKRANIVIVGLAKSGKSTIMHQLKPRDIQMHHLMPSIPVGYPAEQFHAKTLTVVAFELGDKKNGFSNPWEDFYRDCHAIIFVVDSADRFSMAHAQEQLDLLLSNPILVKKETPLLVLANKSDNPGAIPNLQCAQILGLNSIKSRPWDIYDTDALTGDGFNEALDWLAHQLRRTCMS